MYIYESTFKEIDFFCNQSVSFIAWICPLLKTQVMNEDQYVFFEGDKINAIYFLQKGSAGYVLPRQDNLMYVELNEGFDFGISCIIG